MKKILLTESINIKGVELLEKYFTIIKASDTDEKTLTNLSGDCYGILVRTAKITSKIIENSPELKIISRHGSGYDNVDIESATKRGVLVVNAPLANIDSVAEHVICMILALAKNLIQMDYNTREGNYHLRNSFLNIEIKNKTLGIIGFGKIGVSLAEKIRSFGVKINAYDPYLKSYNSLPSHVTMKLNIDDVFKESDIITIHVPLNNNTRKMIGKPEFLKMKTSCIFVNASRGEVVDEIALHDALKMNHIKAAAIDVFAKEPPEKNNPLFSLKNIIISPHNAALTEESMINMAVDSAQGIVDFFIGDRPKYIVNPEVIL